MRQHNLFKALHTWAWRQDENFVTELLVGFLREALKRTPQAGIEFIDWLAPGLGWTTVDPLAVEVRTQQRSLESIPDIRITAPGRVVDVECKVESPVDSGQLARHLAGVRSTGEPNSGLVLITRYPTPVDSSVTALTAHRRWFEIAKQMSATKWPEPVVDWVAGSIVRFFEERGMIMKRIDENLVPGLSALQQLLLLIDESMVALGIRTARSGNSNEIGRYGEPGSAYPALKQVGVWVQLERPGVVHVQTRDADREKWKQTAGPGEVTRWGWWVLPLDLQAAGFFSPELGLDRQQELFVAKLKECFEYGASIAPSS